MGVQKTLCSERGSIFVFFIDNLAENIGLIPEFCDVFIAITILLYALFRLSLKEIVYLLKHFLFH